MVHVAEDGNDAAQRLGPELFAGTAGDGPLEVLLEVVHVGEVGAGAVGVDFEEAALEVVEAGLKQAEGRAVGEGAHDLKEALVDVRGRVG